MWVFSKVFMKQGLALILYFCIPVGLVIWFVIKPCNLKSILFRKNQQWFFNNDGYSIIFLYFLHSFYWEIKLHELCYECNRHLCRWFYWAGMIVAMRSTASGPLIGFINVSIHYSKAVIQMSNVVSEISFIFYFSPQYLAHVSHLAICNFCLVYKL